MGTFIPPIEGSLPSVTVGAPTKEVLDESGHRAVLISEITGPASLKAVAPITSYATQIQLGGAPFVRLSPLPAGAGVAEVFRELTAVGAAMPTFYLGGPGIDPSLAGTVAAGGTILTGQSIFLGATLGPLALAPREWARVLLEAMTRANEPDLQPWTDFVAALGDRALYILRHTGQPPEQGDLEFDFRLANGATGTASPGDGGNLTAAVSGDLFADGARIRLQTPAGGVPYHTAFDSDVRSSPELDAPADDRWFHPSLLPTTSGTILCTDLNGWFGERPAGIPLKRWHAGNRVEPLLDGNETFTRLWGDLQPLLAEGAPTMAGGVPLGLWAAGLVFHDFELQPGVEASKFVDLVKELTKDGFQVRLLGAKGFMFEGTESEEQMRLLAFAVLFVLAGIGLGSVALEALDMDLDDVTWGRLTLAAVLLILATSPLFVDKISDKLDFSKEAFEALTPEDDDAARIALWSRYPARFSDNPSADYPAAVIEELVAVERTGWHHMKMQVLTRPQENKPAPEYVAYLGGIDLNKNRIDSWSHHWPPNYHDVHARLTGPAAADVFQTFYERWEDELRRRPAEEGPAAANTCPRYNPRPGRGHDPTASLSAIPDDLGDHIVQIGRTLYRPAPANAAEGFYYAPQGEASVHDSILRAIHAAREYIYIEDQYMTFANSGGAGDEIFEALVDAATRCKALILVFPQGTNEQLFGHERRNGLLAKLQQSWGALPGREFLPLIHSRQLLGAPGLVSGRGRSVLQDPIADNATEIRVADGIRVPKAPCWAWIEGELVLVVDRDNDDGDPTGIAVLEIVRGAPLTQLDSSARAHKAGAPVTFTDLDDVFIHAKVVLIDDVYASIGSANMNRRSMYHDGELNAHVVPGRLRAAADNPVRSLRCRIWADHAGIPPQLAESELADPIAALPLLMRPRAAGNPLSRHELLDNNLPEGIEIQTKTAMQTLATIFGGLGQVGGEVAKAALWRTLIDPTTSLDPFFDTEPFEL